MIKPSSSRLRAGNAKTEVGETMSIFADRTSLILCRVVAFGLISVSLGCNLFGEPKTGSTDPDQPPASQLRDASVEDIDSDAGTSWDAGTTVATPQDGGSISGNYDCSAITAHNDWELCDEGPESCAAVFYDGAGCHEVCAAVGLGCAEIWDNVDNQCAADESRPQLGCDVITGHDSDYCLCRGPVTDPPENPSTTASYENLFDELVGFGAATTGGKGGTICTVTTTSNSGSGSLRKCVEDASGPTWIRFSVDGDIQLNSNITLPSNITIDARGHYIRIYNGGMVVNNNSNVIITNLIFKEGPSGDDKDAIQVKGGDKIWIHHCSLSNYNDGLIDLTKGTKDATLSWNKFSDHDKVILISANDNDTEDENTRVTLHHNWFKETKQRHPRVRHGKVHAYNNFFDKWGSYGMGCSTNSECYSEKNVFQANLLDLKFDAIVTKVGEDSGDGEVESHEDLLLDGAAVDERGSVFTPSDFYSYTADSTTGLADLIEANAGAQ